MLNYTERDLIPILTLKHFFTFVTYHLYSKEDWENQVLNQTLCQTNMTCQNWVVDRNRTPCP